MPPQTHIGCSGWAYKDWRGPFYPDKLAQKDWFGFYATRFDTTELNASFYRLPAEQTVRGWADKTPAGFVWAWKASRFITHQKRLKDCEDSLTLVLGRMDPLGHAGPVLFQLPPSMKRDDDRLAGFIKLPAETTPGRLRIPRSELVRGRGFQAVARRQPVALLVGPSPCARALGGDG